MVTWSKSILEDGVAPEITSFTKASMPDLRAKFPEAPHWLGNHFLNTVFRGGYKSGMRQAAVAFLRRAKDAFQTYHAARDLSLEYLKHNDPLNPGITKFYELLGLWENFVFQCGVALDIFKWMNEGEGAFEKNDGSKEFRLHKMSNQIKHLTSCIDSGQCKPTELVPLWLSKDGLQSFEITVSFNEAAEILSDIAELANQLQDPLSFVKVSGES